MLDSQYPYYLANRAVFGPNMRPVVDKWTGASISQVSVAGADVVEAAIAASEKAAPAMAQLPAWRRRDALLALADGIERDFDGFAEALVMEAGKTISHARGEVGRALETLREAAGEATRIEGTIQPLDHSARSTGYQAFCKRVPIGPCAFIAPFNFPLNLVAHKVAPALAMGCPFVLKPASRTPISALKLGAILATLDLPEGAFSILPASRADAAPLTTDPRIKAMSFTGSPAVGWALKAKAGKKRVTLELGGNAACIVESDADLARAVARITVGAFYQAGQSCIGVQRIFAHASVYDALKTQLVAAAAGLVSGDRFDPATFNSPMISLAEAERVEAWVNDAIAAGGRVLTGGVRDGATYAPTLLEGVPRDCKVVTHEVFGPVACIEPYTDFKAAVDAVNEGRFGLQAGVFTRDLVKAMYAFDHLEVGGVVIDDIPSMRVDAMPYGGVKDSGFGREGPRFAMEELSEIRVMLLCNKGQL